jgi:subtilase family serine protease
LASFAKIGDVVEVFIDADNKLVEDNENNNILTKKIAFAMPAGAAVPVIKK